MRRVHAGSLMLLSSLVLACAKPSAISVDRAIREPSGVTASPTHENVFWVHGDSGTGNWLFAIDREAWRSPLVEHRTPVNCN